MAHLSVDGEIWLRETGEKIFLFQTSIMIDLKTQNPKTVAYQIGVAIAHFIVPMQEEDRDCRDRCSRIYRFLFGG